MACSQVTLDIAQDLLSHSLSTRLILWSADTGRDCVLLTLGISIGLPIRSVEGFLSQDLLSRAIRLLDLIIQSVDATSRLSCPGSNAPVHKQGLV